mmetsp:Transcript_9623/g.26979  ORF Transcript_9623/g.26979 Transcript_9623/m.26979 type:complete len:237 (-) Transcript_9623:66-776(-)
MVDDKDSMPLAALLSMAARRPAAPRSGVGYVFSLRPEKALAISWVAAAEVLVAVARADDCFTRMARSFSSSVTYLSMSANFSSSSTLASSTPDFIAALANIRRMRVNRCLPPAEVPPLTDAPSASSASSAASPMASSPPFSARLRLESGKSLAFLAQAKSSSSCFMKAAKLAASVSSGWAKMRLIHSSRMARRSETNSVVNLVSDLRRCTRLWGMTGMIAPGLSRCRRSYSHWKSL